MSSLLKFKCCSEDTHTHTHTHTHTLSWLSFHLGVSHLRETNTQSIWFILYQSQELKYNIRETNIVYQPQDFCSQVTKTQLIFFNRKNVFIRSTQNFRTDGSRHAICICQKYRITSPSLPPGLTAPLSDKLSSCQRVRSWLTLPLVIL